MINYMVFMFILLIIYFFAKLVIDSAIANHKQVLKQQKKVIKSRINNKFKLGQLTELEKRDFKDENHKIIMQALKKKTRLAIFQKYIGLPGAIMALVSAVVALGVFEINKHYDPLLELINIVKNSNIQADQTTIIKLERNIDNISNLSNAAIALSSVSQILLTILLIVDLFRNETKLLSDELDEINEELNDLLANS